MRVGVLLLVAVALALLAYARYPSIYATYFMWGTSYFLTTSTE